MTSESKSHKGGFQLRTNVDLMEIRSRLRSEYGCAVQSEEEISGILANVDRDLDDCKAETSRLQARIVSLRNQCQRLENYKACLKSLRSPIRRLPNETLLLIFDFACDMNELSSKSADYAALMISGVCSRWRDLAKFHPDLWSCIHIHIDKAPLHLPSFPILNLYLSSSQRSPLTIKIAGLGFDGPLNPHHLAMCATLARCSTRWKKLRVDPTVWEALTMDHPLPCPVLEEVAVPIFGPLSSLDRFQDVPKLCKLAIGMVTFVGLQEHEGNFPWKRLVTLKIAQFDKGMRNVFQVCSNLRDVHFHLLTQIRFEHCALPITAPVVERLSFSLPWTYQHESLANILSSIICPSLTSLLVEGPCGCTNPWPEDELNKFVTRSSFRLTTLSIKYTSFSDSDLIDLLHPLPALLHLTIDDSRVPLNESPITTHLLQSLHAFVARPP
ncbi:hypothetical protein BT96DRAFT_420421 [Gymnopus androsaceus JB14]|uniref:F-box domain-containing protein n=1 Tax=Gymnopus androsaceus JB14 TaxID=1447944 RepID=A0A6A4I202_9AGAR|nr:hypothetical protein BT96DRAFT_420421 [Gymnopus androsaceus JB14]